jgi:hypothetical protein
MWVSNLAEPQSWVRKIATLVDRTTSRVEHASILYRCRTYQFMLTAADAMLRIEFVLLDPSMYKVLSDFPPVCSSFNWSKPAAPLLSATEHFRHAQDSLKQV